MSFPYNRYQKLTEPFSVYYAMGAESLARSVAQTVAQASQMLSQLLHLPLPPLELLLVEMDDWPLVPRDEQEEVGSPHPYLTDVTPIPLLVVPTEVDALFGDITPEKFAFMLYHELVLAFLESDPRPWPADNPLWADEWQFKFVALWLSQQLDGVHGIVNRDLFEQYTEIFDPEPDGKTPDTVRGFDWYADTDSESYLGYELLLEQFAADLLAHYDITILPRFLALYRIEHEELLSDDVTNMLASVLAPDGSEWLEALVYF